MLPKGAPHWFEMPRGTLLPSNLVNDILGGVKWVNNRVRGRCFILLGDSTMTETATDFGFLLGGDFLKWGHASTHAHATNKHGPAQFQKYTDTATNT